MPPVVGGLLEDVAPDLLAQLAASDRVSRVVDEAQVTPHALLLGNEVPGVDPRTAFRGSQAGTDRGIDRIAVVDAAELEPDVAEAGIVAVLEKVPAHRASGPGERVEASRRQVGVEHERQEKLQCLRLA